MNKLLVLVAASGVASLVGCQTVPYQGQARNVSVTPNTTGVISIPTTYRDEDRAKADELMKRNCGPYAPQITSEGEVAVGTKVDSNNSTTNRESTKREVGSLFGLPITSGDAGGSDTSASSTTTQLKEWHISYKCQKKNSKVL